VDRRLAVPLAAGSADGFAVDPMTPAGMPVTAATQATKQRWNWAASRAVKISPTRSCGGVPSLNGRKRRSRGSFFSPKRAMSVKVGPSKDGQQGQKQHLVERIHHLSGLPAIGQGH